MKFRRKNNGRSPNIARRSALSYYRSGPPPAKSPFQRTPRPKRRRYLTKALDWLVVLAVLGGIVYSLLLQPDPSIVLNSTAYHPVEAYRDATAANLKSLKNRNKLTFDEDSLLSSLKQKFPEISDISVDLPLFGQVPTVHIGIAQPSLMLKSAAGSTNATERFIVDSKGTVVGSQSNFPAIKDLPLINDETGFGAQIGRSVLSLSDVNFILSVIAQAKKANIPIASLTLPKLAQELDLRTTDRSYFIKFYLAGDALAQSGQFLAARKHFDQTKKQPRQYLDVRVSGKVYFK